jgi:hypothetical protein
LAVVRLFGRRRATRVGAPKPKSRRETSSLAVNHVGLHELTPDIIRYLSQAAYLQLSIFETLTGCLDNSPSTAAKEAISKIAAVSLAKHRGLVAEIERRGEDPGAVMAPYAPRIDEFRRTTLGADWHETLITCYVTAGILDELYVSVAAGLPGDYPARMTALLAGDEESRLLAAVLRDAIEANPHLASRLAMWGRRLVGDTLLMARAALALPDNTAPDDARLEPVFTELIAAHTRRMDNLGLTA